MWVPNENCKIFELIIMFLAINVNVFNITLSWSFDEIPVIIFFRVAPIACRSNNWLRHISVLYLGLWYNSLTEYWVSSSS